MKKKDKLLSKRLETNKNMAKASARNLRGYYKRIDVAVTIRTFEREVRADTTTTKVSIVIVREKP